MISMGDEGPDSRCATTFALRLIISPLQGFRGDAVRSEGA